MHYSYRWWYALMMSGLILIGAFLYDIRPSELRLHRLQSQKQRLMTEVRVHAPKRWPSQVVAPRVLVSLVDVMAELALLSHWHGMTLDGLDEVMRSPKRHTEAGLLRLVSHGDFKQMAAFMLALTQGAYPISIRDVSFRKTASHEMLLTMEMTVPNYTLASTLKPAIPDKPPHYDPFCLAADGSEFVLDQGVSQGQAMSLKVIKMIGYLAEGRKREAWVLLPDQTIFSVQVGERLGNERGVITAIWQDRIHLLLPDKSEWEVKM